MSPDSLLGKHLPAAWVLQAKERAAAQAAGSFAERYSRNKIVSWAGWLGERSFRRFLIEECGLDPKTDFRWLNERSILRDPWGFIVRGPCGFHRMTVNVTTTLATDGIDQGDVRIVTREPARTASLHVAVLLYGQAFENGEGLKAWLAGWIDWSRLLGYASQGPPTSKNELGKLSYASVPYRDLSAMEEILWQFWPRPIKGGRVGIR